MNRRSFIAALAALSLVGRLAPKAKAVTLPFPFAGDPRFHGGMRLVVYRTGAQDGQTMTMQVSRDGKTWHRA
jgi:hypothetical protein